jgi:pyridinium-3,5-biscarboxylic acid mononucleotide synthase
MHQHDHDRRARIGMPEAVLCGTKSVDQVIGVVRDLVQETSEPRLLTRLTEEQLAGLHTALAVDLDDDRLSQTAFLNGTLPRRCGTVAIVAAGTSDASVAKEVARTLQFSGVEAQLIVDVGVAGLWRLEARLDEIRAADVVIAVAGMDAAIVSVLGGLVAAPIVAVPTSVGYGVAAGGSTALNSALASCAQGVTVVNIDNGFGAACAAVRMLSLLYRNTADGDASYGGGSIGDTANGEAL